MFFAICISCNEKMEYGSRQTANFAKRNKIVCKTCRNKRKREQEDLKKVRKCPSCNEDIIYKRATDANTAEKKNQTCKKCFGIKNRSQNYSGLKRNCPSCNKEMEYLSIDSCTRANKINDVCKSCSLKGQKPSPQCIEAMLKANTGKIHTEETKLKKKNSWLAKYGHKTYLQSKDYKEKMIKSGKIGMLFGDSPRAWTVKYDIPTVSIYKWLDGKKDISKEELLDFCENYQKKISDIENVISQEFNLELWDKFPQPNLKYKPDFKLTDKIFLNADGLYWHSELVSKLNYHFEMRKNYEQLGLRIIQFRADEIFNKFPIVKSIINNALNQTIIKIGARKTKVKKIDFEVATQFLNQNHMKGYKSAKHLGLYYQDELVSLMSYKMGKNKSNQAFLKIERFCSKININVMGAFSKLLKEIQKEIGDIPIHYWVDLRYGTGNFLLNQGFKLEKETLGWEWTDSQRTYNRLKCRANMDERGLSEKEYASELKWVKIYDAGQRLYVRNK